MLDPFETTAKAIADPSRTRIVKLLEQGELCVCQITTILDLAAATISKHLSLLKMAGLVQQRRDGKWVYYRLADGGENPYALPFLALLKNALNDDPTILADLNGLGRIRAIPLNDLCTPERR